MSLTLKKIELFNFRHHEHFIFEPDKEGITAISGHNGAGKSTIVDAFAWALYGTRPSKVTNKMLIRDGVETKNSEVKAVIEISINKIDYKIIRRIVSDSGATDCNVYGRADNGVYNILAGPAVSSAEAYVKQIMGMDEKGFLTSVLIQQKQVDQIVSASARERASVIEKLTGISSITEAIDLSRSEMKAYQRAANVITVKDSESINKEINKIKQEASLLKVKLQEETEEYNTDKDTIDKMTIQLESDTEKYNHAEELGNNRNLIKQNEKMLKEELRRIVDYLSKFKRDHHTMIVSDPKELKKSANKQLQLYLNAKNTLEREAKELSDLSTTIRDNEAFMADKSTIIADSAKTLESLNTINASILDMKDRLQVLTSSRKQSKKALSTVSSGDMVCPVCKRPIDNPEDLTKELNEELAKIASDEKALKLELKNEENNQAELTSKLADIQEQITRLEELERLNETLPEKKTILAQHTAKVDDLKSKSDILGKDYDKAVKEFLHKEDIDNKKSRLDDIDVELGNINESLNSIDKELADTDSLKKSEVNARRKQLEDLSKKNNKLLIAQNQDKSNYQYLGKRYKDLVVEYKEAVSAQKKYEELTNEMKVSAVSNSVMSEFKVDRIQFAVPTIEMYASTILSQFTDGKFTQMKLDGKFNASVLTAGGIERPIAQLSGGELSASAIALRLSISMLLNGADKNVIIFDEVLVSMDEMRARKIMETISSVTNSQVIFIAHNSDIDSVADLVVQVGNADNQED